ncbi:MAG: helix-turn-helix domain-containing protein, partial [Magnetococcales bacterium]|nr:helix-turn-helix domain-containing protein [Magnetococcales bacterium]
MSKQLELFQTDVSWFHWFKEMIRTKTWANMSAPAKALYPVMKAFTNYQDGRSFPSYDTLMIYSGLSRASIMKALAELEQLGYVRKEQGKGRRSSVYCLVEKFNIKSEDGCQVASASFDYLPSRIQEAVAELRNFIAKGMVSESRTLQYVHIDHLTLNMPGRDLIKNQINVDTDKRRLLRGLHDRLAGIARLGDPVIARIGKIQQPHID